MTCRTRLDIQAIVVPGDPTEELLYQGRAQQADLIVLGAQGASAFAAITRHGVVYKVLAHCPLPGAHPVAGSAGPERRDRRKGFGGGDFPCRRLLTTRPDPSAHSSNRGVSRLRDCVSEDRSGRQSRSPANLTGLADRRRILPG